MRTVTHDCNRLISWRRDDRIRGIVPDSLVGLLVAEVREQLSDEVRGICYDRKSKAKAFEGVCDSQKHVLQEILVYELRCNKQSTNNSPH
jgi:hypothetical protein